MRRGLDRERERQKNMMAQKNGEERLVGKKENDSDVEKRKCENREETEECERILERGRNFKREIKCQRRVESVGKREMESGRRRD